VPSRQLLLPFADVHESYVDPGQELQRFRRAHSGQSRRCRKFCPRSIFGVAFGSPTRTNSPLARHLVDEVNESRSGVALLASLPLNLNPGRDNRPYNDANRDQRIMLSLDSPRWATLQHAYGDASDIPALLRQLTHFPPSDGNKEPWFTLWSAWEPV
jgi:hypothetical protein